MKHKKVENIDEDSEVEILEVELIDHSELSQQSNIQDNDKLLENESVRTYNKEDTDTSSDESDDNDEEENTQTSAIFDSIMSDNRVIASLSGAVLLFIGSYLSFWGVIADTVKLSQGNLFTGYMYGGIFGKLCVILSAVCAVLVCIRVYKVAWYLNVASFVAYIVQVLLILINGKNVLGDTVNVTIYPAFGSIICLVSLIIMLVFTRKLSKATSKRKKNNNTTSKL